MNKPLNVCLFASEVAAMIGKNPYKHPVEVLLTLWQRQNHGVSFAQAQDRVAVRQSVSRETVGSSHQVIGEAVKKNDILTRAIDILKKQVNEQDLPTVLKKAEVQVQEIMTRQKAECQQNAQLRDSAVGTLLGVNSKSQVKVTEKEVKDYIRSSLSQSYGHAREKQTLQDVPDIKQNNNKFYCRALGSVEDCRYQLGGKIDGLQNNRLVEIKNRKQRFMQPLPLYDVIQSHCYMWLLEKTECHLIEQLASGQRKETVIAWDPKLWEQITTGIKQFMRVFTLVYHNRQYQDDLLSSCASKIQQKWYVKWLQSDKISVDK